MKGYKGIVPIALVVCMVLSFYMLISTRAATVNEYNGYLSVARAKAEQEIAVDALENYSKALGVKNTLEVQLEVGNFFVKMKDVTGAIGWGEQMVEAFPHAPQAYEFLLTRYREVNDYNRCFALYETINKRKLSSEGIKATMEGIKYVYYYGEAYDNVKAFSQGYCAVEYEGKWGLARENGTKSAPTMFASVGSYVGGLAPVVTTEGEAYFIDDQGNKKMAVLIESEIKELNPVAGDSFSVYNGTTWAFYNKNYEKISGDYTDVTVPSEGVLAVEIDGKWAIVNHNFQPTSENRYAGVVKDERDIVYRNGVIFVNQDGAYRMVDAAGNAVSDKTFLDAKTFLDNTYAAVKTDKGWTFVNNKGEFVFGEIYYEDAHSFINGFAAVKSGGQWGYIDTQGNVAIEFQFADVKDFNARGCAFTKTEGAWHMIRLYSKNYEK